uniref:Vacuolar protein sorting-associated protein 54 N-terminal domain-containing protein n=1 Tax=Monodelphis domestica TaxID=13616 RepID=A0A5F8GVT1_MONDO
MATQLASARAVIRACLPASASAAPFPSPSLVAASSSARVPGPEEARECREPPSDPHAQQEIIDSIEDVYFSTDSFDIVKYEMEKLPPVLNLQELEEYRDKLKEQQAAVSKKVADLILEKQPAYVKELERVTSLQTGLQLATVICTNGRRYFIWNQTCSDWWLVGRCEAGGLPSAPHPSPHWLATAIVQA